MSAERNRGLVAILSANIIFGLNVPVTKALVAQWMTPTGYTMTRMFFGAIVFWTIGLFQKDERVRGWDLGLLAVGGLLGYLGTQFLFALSLRHTTPVHFSLLMALTPVVVLALSALLLKERVTPRKLFGSALSVSGASIMILWAHDGPGTGVQDGLGLLYAALCMLCFAAYLLLTRQVALRYRPVTVAKWMFLFSALVLLPFVASGLPGQRIYSAEIDLSGIALLAFALLFSTTLAFFLMPFALRRLQASTVSIFMNLQPVVAAVVAIAVGQDVLTGDKLVAALLVLAGVHLVTRPAKQAGDPVHIGNDAGGLRVKVVKE
ncbi:MAG: DMT family transporter [Flavobacteriales bacterium]|nr:DMT family transporter [Flavobacteriales bacterium]MCB9166229.1 DMT family transporter [Flavobacteriales bacterium]